MHLKLRRKRSRPLRGQAAERARGLRNTQIIKPLYKQDTLDH
jgi:hypothetical protein